MNLRISGLLCTGALVLSGAAVQAQDNHLNARDAFWSAADLVGTPPVTRISKKMVKPATRKQSKAASPESQTGSEQGSAKVEEVANVSNDAPLGLRYTLLKELQQGKYSEVLPDSTFKAGDHVRVSVMANEPSYLYIVQQGSSGSWSPLYPQPGMPNRLEPGKRTLFPPEGEFTFDQSAGQDKMFILLTRQPVSDLDETILSLRHDAVKDDSKVHLASNKINDIWAQQFQSTMGSRDLIFTKADSEAPAAQDTTAQERFEKAMYVVNQNKSPDSKIVVQLTLKHQ